MAGLRPRICLGEVVGTGPALRLGAAPSPGLDRPSRSPDGPAPSPGPWTPRPEERSGSRSRRPLDAIGHPLSPNKCDQRPRYRLHSNYLSSVRSCRFAAGGRAVNTAGRSAGGDRLCACQPLRREAGGGLDELGLSAEAEGRYARHQRRGQDVQLAATAPRRHRVEVVAGQRYGGRPQKDIEGRSGPGHVTGRDARKDEDAVGPRSHRRPGLLRRVGDDAAVDEPAAPYEHRRETLRAWPTTPAVPGPAGPLSSSTSFPVSRSVVTTVRGSTPSRAGVGAPWTSATSPAAWS